MCTLLFQDSFTFDDVVRYVYDEVCKENRNSYNVMDGTSQDNVYLVNK